VKTMHLVINPNAGTRQGRRFLPDIIAAFNRAGWLCAVRVTDRRGDAADYVRDHTAGADLIVACGGDGTLNEVITGLQLSGQSIPLGYIPCGTTNDYAASIGLSSDVLQAARDIIEGKPQTVDVGAFNGRYFVYTATCGAFAKASYSTPQAAKNVLGHMAYVLEGMRDLTTIKPIHMKVRANELVLEDDFIFCSITNSTSVGGILRLDTQLVALNDGRFEVTMVRNPLNPAQLSSILVGLTTQSVPNDMIHFFSAQKISIECDDPLEWTLDGERESETDSVAMENLHSAIRIMIPRRMPAAPFKLYKEEAEL